jgi:sec-independent protein translocase protein TatA
LALGGWEWIVIILAVVVILVWGPTKIPELARGLGRARGEFERASKDYTLKPLETEAVSKASGDEMMVVIAKGLGINTEGKSKEQIFQEIIVNIKAIKSSS